MIKMAMLYIPENGLMEIMHTERVAFQTKRKGELNYGTYHLHGTWLLGSRANCL